MILNMTIFDVIYDYGSINMITDIHDENTVPLNTDDQFQFISYPDRPNP